MQRIGSHEALEKRQALRLAEKLNKPIRPRPHKSQLRTSIGHPWECECEVCRPWLWRDGEKVNTDREDLKHKYAPKQEQKVMKIEGKKGFPKPRKKWSDQRGRSSN